MGNAHCCESTSDYPAEVVSSIGFEEAQGNADGHSPKAMEQKGVEVISVPLKTEDGGEASPQSTRSGQEMLISPKRKPHMQAYARDFVREMANGKEVQLLTHQAESLEPSKAAAQCTIDSKLQFLTISKNADGDVKAKLANIKNVYAVEDNGKAAFPAKVLEMITPEEHDKLLLIKYDLGEGKEGSIIFMEDSVESRKRFAECMNYIVKSMQKGP